MCWKILSKFIIPTGYFSTGKVHGVNSTDPVSSIHSIAQIIDVIGGRTQFLGPPHTSNDENV